MIPRPNFASAAKASRFAHNGMAYLATRLASVSRSEGRSVRHLNTGAKLERGAHVTRQSLRS